MKKKPRVPSRPAVPGGKLPGGKNLCVFCSKRLSLDSLSIADVQDGIVCPACAKRYGSKLPVCPPAVNP